MSQEDTPTGKLDPFAEAVESPEGDSGGPASGGDEVKGLNPRVVVFGGIAAAATLATVIMVMTLRAEQDTKNQREAALEEERREFVEVDKARADFEAKKRMEEANAEREAEKRRAAEAAKLAQAQDTVLGGPGGEAPDGPTLSGPGPGPSDPASPDANKKPDPWVQAREQYRATVAQRHYTLMAQARTAPIFGKGGSPTEDDGTSGRASHGGTPLPEAQSPQEAEFLARVRQVQGQGMVRHVGGQQPTTAPGFASSVQGAQGSRQGASGSSSARFASTTPPSSGAVGCGLSASCVQAGTVVQAVLATEINTETPGMIVAQVVKPVWNPGLTRIVIPAGSKLLGEYDTNVETGQTRTPVAWTRLILSTGDSVGLDRFPGASLSGSSGVPSDVDEHWDKLLAGAALSGAFAASGAALSGTTNQLAVDPRQQAALGGARPLQEIGERRAQKYLETRPTLTVPQGARVGMLVTSDLLLPPRPSRGVFREGEHR